MLELQALFCIWCLSFSPKIFPLFFPLNRHSVRFVLSRVLQWFTAITILFTLILDLYTRNSYLLHYVVFYTCSFRTHCDTPPDTCVHEASPSQPALPFVLHPDLAVRHWGGHTNARRSNVPPSLLPASV